MERNHIFYVVNTQVSRAFKESEVMLAIFTGTLIGPVSEVHIVETHGENGIEVGVLSQYEIQWTHLSLWYPERLNASGTSFINSEESSGPVMNCSKEESKEEKGVRYEERKVTTSHKETWAAPSSWKQDADTIILTQNQEHLCTKWAIPRNEKVDNDSCKLSSLESLDDNDFETSYVNVSSLLIMKRVLRKKFA